MGQNDSSHSYRLVGLWGRFLPQFCKDASDYVTFKASPRPPTVHYLNVCLRKTKTGERRISEEFTFTSEVQCLLSQSICIKIKGPY